MSWRRIPEPREVGPQFVWSIGKQDARILRIGFLASLAGVIVGSAGIALIDTSLAAFAILIFIGVMIPAGAAIFVADHPANQPEDTDDTPS